MGQGQLDSNVQSPTGDVRPVARPLVAHRRGRSAVVGGGGGFAACIFVFFVIVPGAASVVVGGGGRGGRRRRWMRRGTGMDVDAERRRGAQCVEGG
jgi:hypothetical protein